MDIILPLNVLFNGVILDTCPFQGLYKMLFNFWFNMDVYASFHWLFPEIQLN